MPIYSFGADSPLKFELSEEYAEAFNRAMQSFFDAQDEHLQKTGSKWTPDQALLISWTEEEMQAFNGFDAVLVEALILHGSSVHEDELTSDFLVKN